MKGMKVKYQVRQHTTDLKRLDNINEVMQSRRLLKEKGREKKGEGGRGGEGV